ncbi:MAG: flagellar biosynthetic protein FliR, partial [Clostridia bacterium]|nr:flagellar biosynthetic protein FliR [Clostridia bacterium]
MWDLLYSNYMVFLAIFTRMAGMLIFNPFFGRKNIPVIIKMGFAFFTTVILMGFLPPNTTVQAGNALTFMLICGKELLVGFAVGFIMQIFLSSLQVAGSFMDLQLGVGMANVYDPQSNISMALSATLLNL